MEIKGLKRIDKVINDFTKQFGITAFIDPINGFQAYTTEMKVSYTLFVDEEWLDCFANEANTRYEGINANPFLWGIMHEIGHCMTDIWDFEDEKFFEQMKKKLDNFETAEEINTWYHVLPDEYFATRWAADFMWTHPKKMRKFCEKMNKAIQNFCEKNNFTP